MTEKSTPAGPEIDLFGDIWTPPKDPRGRKAHVRQPQIAEKIAFLVAQGATQEEIEGAVGLSVKTLTRYYSRELDAGPSLAKAALGQMLLEKAKGGNVSAIKAMIAQLEKGDAARADSRVRGRSSGSAGGSTPPAASTGPKLGKKAQRQADAQAVVGAGGLFATPSAPKLVVDNR